MYTFDALAIQQEERKTPSKQHLVTTIKMNYNELYSSQQTPLIRENMALYIL